MNKKYLATLIPVAIIAAAVPGIDAQADEILSYKDFYADKDTSIDRKTYNYTPSLDGIYYPDAFKLGHEWGEQNRLYGYFDVSDTNYTTFEALIGIEDTRRYKGENSTVTFFADDTYLTHINFTSKSSSEQVKINIPTGTSKLRIYHSTTTGSSRHQLVIEKPTLTNSLPATEKTFADYLLNYATVSPIDGYYTVKWGNAPFLLDKKIVARGFGLGPEWADVEYNIATFDVSESSATTLEATIGLDQARIDSKIGKRNFEIFADGIKIYNNEITRLKEPEKIEVAIPKGTKRLQFVSTHDYFSNYPGIVVDNPVLTNKLPQQGEQKAIRLTSLTATSSDRVSVSNWSIKDIFKDSEDLPFYYGIGFSASRSATNPKSTIKYYVADEDYKYFDTTVTIPADYTKGDYGNVTFSVLADNKTLQKVTLDSKKVTQNVSVAIPKNTKYLELQTSYQKGGIGYRTLIAKDTILRNGFSDVATFGSNYSEINYLVGLGIINGYPDGTFKPNNTLTRANAALLIARAMKLGTANSMKFTDVPKSDSGYGEIAAAVNAGLFDNIAKDKFDMKKPLTRGEMADILVKAFDLEKLSNDQFTDTNNHWASDSIIALRDNQITTGYPNNLFKPNETLTRGHFTLFMARALNESYR